VQRDAALLGVARKAVDVGSLPRPGLIEPGTSRSAWLGLINPA
jgi:hypothetical protein